MALWLVGLRAWLDGEELLRAPAVGGRKELEAALSGAEMWYEHTLKKQHVRAKATALFSQWASSWRARLMESDNLLAVHVGFARTAVGFLDKAMETPRDFGVRHPRERADVAVLRQKLVAFDAALCEAALAKGSPVEDTPLWFFDDFEKLLGELGAVT